MARPIRYILLGKITRRLRNIRGLKSSAFIVGGLITEGKTLRDIDIVVQNPDDIPKLKKALGSYAKIAHFIYQKEEPPAPIYLKITGKNPKSPDLIKTGKIPKHEYAG